MRTSGRRYMNLRGKLQLDQSTMRVCVAHTRGEEEHGELLESEEHCRKRMTPNRPHDFELLPTLSACAPKEM